jgi:hypothetical protein
MKRLRKVFLLGLLLVFAAVLSTGQVYAAAENDDQEVAEEAVDEIEEIDFVEEVDGLDTWDDEGRARSERTINVLEARTTRRGALIFVLDHRTWKTFTEEPIHDFLGFDNGQLKIGLAARYGIFDCLDVGLQRVNGTAERFKTDTWDLDLRYHALKQDKHFLDVSVRGGVTWFSVEDADDREGYFGQLAINRTFGRRVRAGTGLLYHSDSYNENRDRGDQDYSMAVPGTLDIRFTPSFSWHGEIVANVGGFKERYPVLSTSLRATTNKHTFALVVSNTQYFGAAGIATNTFRDNGDLILGFTITREFRFRRPGE